MLLSGALLSQIAAIHCQHTENVQFRKFSPAMLSGLLTRSTAVITSGYDNDAVSNTVSRSPGQSGFRKHWSQTLDSPNCRHHRWSLDVCTLPNSRTQSPITVVTHAEFTFQRTTLRLAHTILQQSGMLRIRYMLKMLSRTPDPPLVTYPLGAGAVVSYSGPAYQCHDMIAGLANTLVTCTTIAIYGVGVTGLACKPHTHPH